MIELHHKQTGLLLYRIAAETLDRVDLHGASLEGVDLQAMRLCSANLRGAHLVAADLSECMAPGTDFQSAVFDGATLQRIDLNGADLREASLRSADLRGARLRGARLDGANLEWAALQGADLSGASVSEANFFGADLCGAVLAEVHGLNSASLTDALYDEATQWPEGFAPQDDDTARAHKQPPWQYSLRTLLSLVTALAVVLAIVQAAIRSMPAADAARRSIDLLFAAFIVLPPLVLGILFLYAARKVLNRGSDGAPNRAHEPSERQTRVPEAASIGGSEPRPSGSAR